MTTKQGREELAATIGLRAVGKALRIYYRNGKPARILLTDRKGTKFCVLSIDKSTGVIYHHISDGSNNLDRAESQWDLIDYK